ncbi:hypothetical protein F4809DRAFT_139974 [Biscogniauxia mediterranea]|nr:hypothetical protein F4809DRAFT_139974 [Biscogniauxia mediterranea]
MYVLLFRSLWSVVLPTHYLPLSSFLWLVESSYEIYSSIILQYFFFFFDPPPASQCLYDYLFSYCCGDYRNKGQRCIYIVMISSFFFSPRRSVHGMLVAIDQYIPLVNFLRYPLTQSV